MYAKGSAEQREAALGQLNSLPPEAGPTLLEAVNQTTQLADSDRATLRRTTWSVAFKSPSPAAPEDALQPDRVEKLATGSIDDVLATLEEMTRQEGGPTAGRLVHVADFAITDWSFRDDSQRHRVFVGAFRAILKVHAFRWDHEHVEELLIERLKSPVADVRLGACQVVASAPFGRRPALALLERLAEEYIPRDQGQDPAGPPKTISSIFDASKRALRSLLGRELTISLDQTLKARREAAAAIRDDVAQRGSDVEKQWRQSILHRVVCASPVEVCVGSASQRRTVTVAVAPTEDGIDEALVILREGGLDVARVGPAGLDTTGIVRVSAPWGGSVFVVVSRFGAEHWRFMIAAL